LRHPITSPELQTPSLGSLLCEAVSGAQPHLTNGAGCDGSQRWRLAPWWPSLRENGWIGKEMMLSLPCRLNLVPVDLFPVVTRGGSLRPTEVVFIVPLWLWNSKGSLLSIALERRLCFGVHYPMSKIEPQTFRMCQGVSHGGRRVKPRC
jgi:hypothetical protein